MDAKNIFSGSLVGLRMGNETTLVYLTENVATITLTPVDAMVNTGENAGKFFEATAEIEIAEVDAATIAKLETYRKSNTSMHLILLKGFVDDTTYNEWHILPLIWNLEITRGFGTDLQNVVIRGSKYVAKQSDFCNYTEIAPPPLGGSGSGGGSGSSGGHRRRNNG